MEGRVSDNRWMGPYMGLVLFIIGALIQKIAGQAPTLAMCTDNNVYPQPVLYTNYSTPAQASTSGCACALDRMVQTNMIFTLEEFKCTELGGCPWAIELYVDGCLFKSFCCREGDDRAISLYHSTPGKDLFLQLVPNPNITSDVLMRIRLIAQVVGGANPSSVVSTQCGQDPNSRTLYKDNCPDPTPVPSTTTSSTTTTTTTPSTTVAAPQSTSSSPPDSVSTAKPPLPNVPTTAPPATITEAFPTVAVVAGAIAGVVFIVMLVITVACCSHRTRPARPKERPPSMAQEIRKLQPRHHPNMYNSRPTNHHNGHVSSYDDHNAITPEPSESYSYRAPSEQSSAIAVSNNPPRHRSSRTQLLHDDDLLEETPQYMNTRMVMSTGGKPYHRDADSGEFEDPSHVKQEVIYAEVEKRPKSVSKMTQDDWNKAVDENFEFMDNDMYAK